MPWWVWMIIGMLIAKRVLRWRSRHWWMGHTNPWVRGGWGMAVVGGRHGCGRQSWHGPHRGERSRAEPEVQAPPIELTPAQRQEHAMSDLRRRYVADEITVEEYERELDRLIREH